jgi:PASTA domain
MPVTVPNVIGLGNAAANAALDALLLRHISQFPFGADGDGTATAQSPAAGTVVPSYTIVTVSYPSPLGPLPDSPVEGPELLLGTYDGEVRSVLVGNPYGTGQGAWIEFATLIDGSPVSFTGTLYFDHAIHAPPVLPRTEWMRRGAMLGLAQRAFTNGHKIRVVTASALFIQSIEILKS